MKFTRRQFTNTALATTGLATAGVISPAFADRNDQMNILCWEGYNSDGVLRSDICNFNCPTYYHRFGKDVYTYLAKKGISTTSQRTKETADVSSKVDDAVPCLDYMLQLLALEDNDIPSTPHVPSHGEVTELAQ